MLTRAISMLEIKSIDQEKRIFRGLATSPSPDRVGDSINPFGAQFAKEIPLLHAHKHDMPVGRVRLGKPTAKGIPFEAEIPIINTPPTLKERVDVAWGEVIHGLVPAVSVGFIPKTYNFMATGGINYDEVEIIELSIVACPANSEAMISAVKSIDRQLRKNEGIPDPELPVDNVDAALGKPVRVVKLNDPVGKVNHFVINSIKRK